MASFLSRHIISSELHVSCFLTLRNHIRRKYCAVKVPNPSKPAGSGGAARPSGPSTSPTSGPLNTNSAASIPPQSGEVVQKLTLFQRFKAMYKDYYYVLIPVHCVTSVGWFGAFYQTSKSGVDIGQYLKKIGFSDSIVSKVTDSGMGHVAVAYALYKIATPARYAVTLGGTTWAINRLTGLGIIRPAKEILSKGKEKFLTTKGKFGKE